MKISVRATIEKDTLTQELRDITIHNPNFDGRDWSKHDADTFESIAHLIRREIDCWEKRGR